MRLSMFSVSYQIPLCVGVASDWLQKLYSRQVHFRLLSWSCGKFLSPVAAMRSRLAIFCLLLGAFLLATSPIWVAILFFSQNYKDPSQDPMISVIGSRRIAQLRNSVSAFNYD